jgi:outer membrane protein assembly factor BamB
MENPRPGGVPWDSLPEWVLVRGRFKTVIRRLKQTFVGSFESTRSDIIQEQNVKRLFFAVVVSTMVCGSVSADNWPHWRGTGGNGVANRGTKPPTTWSDTKNVKWKVRIPGRGSGSPIIWADRVYVTTAVPAEPSSRQQDQRTARGRGSSRLQNLEFKLLCFDRENGKQLWEKTATTATPHQGTHSTNGFASASP